MLLCLIYPLGKVDMIRRGSSLLMGFHLGSNELSMPTTLARAAAFKMTVVVLVMGFSMAACSSVQLVSVYKSDGLLQCQVERQDVSLKLMREKLLKNGIWVHHGYSSNDGVMRVQQCGTPADSINVFEIAE